MTNAVGELQEFCVANEARLPKYIESRVGGTDHQPVFKVTCEVAFNGNFYTKSGRGSNKKDAKQKAAASVLTVLKDVQMSNLDSAFSNINFCSTNKAATVNKSQVKVKKEAESLEEENARLKRRIKELEKRLATIKLVVISSDEEEEN